MTIAIQPLDPIAAAEAEIAGSKSLMAAVADDLSQHERWLAHYQLAEKRHARWVMLQELIYRTELALRRLMRFLRRVSLLALRLARRVASFAARTAVFVYTSIRDAVIACFNWLRPRALAFALLSRRWLVASSVWLAAKARALAALLARWSSAAWAWTRMHAAIAWSWIERVARACRRSAALARENRETRESPCPHSLAKFALRRAHYLVLDRALLAGACRSVAALARKDRETSEGACPRSLATVGLRRGHRLGLDGDRLAYPCCLSQAAVFSGLAVDRRKWPASCAQLGSRSAPRIDMGRGSIAGGSCLVGRNVSSGAAWSAAKAKAAAQASIAASRKSYSWAVLRMRAVSNTAFPATAPVIAHTGRALVVRQSTALICFEPKRPGFPRLAAS